MNEKNCIEEIREGRDNRETLFFYATAKRMESWINIERVVFCSIYNAPPLFRNLQKKY